MEITIRAYQATDLPQMVEIWNQVVEDGEAFPQLEGLTLESARAFFAEQTYTAVAVDGDKVCGLYILHPNNEGRCGHIANASYAVDRNSRGRHVGEQLVADSLAQGGRFGFRILQFNAVVATNTAAQRIYEKLGFHQIGTIPKGFRMKDGHYEDIILYYHEM